MHSTPVPRHATVAKTACLIALCLAVIVLCPITTSARTASVTVEAESGTLGADVAIVSGTPAYITLSTDFINSGNPGSSARVASYSVTFPSAGTYNLFGRVRTGPASYDDDSFFYASGFGVKSTTADDDWITCNNTVDFGFTNPDDVVTGPGSSVGEVWKWMNLSEDTGEFGETPVTFTVPAGSLTQTFQVGGREDGLDIDKIVFGKVDIPFTVAHLDAGTTPAQLNTAVPQWLGGNSLSIEYYGAAGGQYAPEWTDSLMSPVTWVPAETNTADSVGLVVFTRTAASSQEFCRIADVTVPAPPTNLTATPGPGQVYLTWEADAFATSFNVLRSAVVNGQPDYMSTNVSMTSLLDTGLVNETLYSYWVSALNANGESAYSAGVSATPSTNITVIPLVYTVEDTGAPYPPPPLPSFSSGLLPVIEPLPDPFMWSSADPYNWTNGIDRFSNFADWSRRRSEIKAEMEEYEIGIKPAVDMADISASFSGGTLTVVVSNPGNPGQTLTLSSSISFPSGSGPHPLMIGMTGFFSIDLGGRPIATMTYNHDQVTTYNGHSTSDPYYQLYSNLGLNTENTGQYSAWAWGVSRLIDGLYKLAAGGTVVDLGGTQIDLERIAVTGCSYAGKMALFAGAFDERVALTIPQESGGGGAPNWRYSATEPDGSVEGLAQTSSSWFKNDMFQFGGSNTVLLPHDHHELMMMVFPRALFATGNPQGAEWLSNPSCYVSCRAVERFYEAFGVEDRFGFNINSGAGHCGTTTLLTEDVGVFLDKFLFGDEGADTVSVRHYVSEYDGLDYARWTDWWGTTNPPTFNGGPSSGTYTNTYEPECATVGANWLTVSDGAASNGKYVTLDPSILPEDLDSASASAAAHIVIPISVPTNGAAAIYARVNCPTFDDDSFWVKVDGGDFTLYNGLSNSGTWTWKSFGSYDLTAGAHTLTIAHRENGALLDKILVSDYQFAPTGMGPDAAILCP